MRKRPPCDVLTDSVSGEMMITELKATSPASLRAVFSFGQSRRVRVELDIGFTGGDDRSEDHLAEIARIIDGNRYHQRLDPACRECDWHQVLNLIRRCHERARLAAGHLITSLRIEDGEWPAGELQSSIKLAESAAAAAHAM
jgi:uncharacterized protein YqgV (UPF0045/DUF77 family)